MHRIDLWFWRLAPAEGAASVLSADEHERARRRADPGGWEKYVAARSRLRTFLAERAGLAPESIEFDLSAFGKPRLRQRPSLHFNLSHSADMAALAICETAEVGVDLEKILETDHVDVAQTYFTPSEIVAIETAPASEQRAAFYKLWTLKEAVLKAMGAGLSTPLDTFEVAIDPPRLTACPRGWEAPELWRLRLSMPVERYVCALAVRSGSVEIEVVERRL